MSDSIPEKLKFSDILEISESSPVGRIDPLRLSAMSPDCIYRKKSDGRLKRSVVSGGIFSPILVNCNGLVVDGKKRLEIAISIGAHYVPCKKIEREISREDLCRLRIMSNPDAIVSPGFRDVLSGPPSVVAELSKDMQRAKQTCKARSEIDIRLQRMSEVYEPSLAAVAASALDSVSCIDAITRNVRGDHSRLLKARKMLEKVIRMAVSTGIPKVKRIASTGISE